MSKHDRVMNKLVFHPLLIAIYPVLFLFSYNIREVFFNQVIFPLVFILLASVIFLLSLNILLKDWNKSGIIASSMLFLFFSYGYFYEFGLSIRKAISFDSVISNKAVAISIFIFWIALAVVIIYKTIRTQRTLRNATHLGNFVSVFLVAMSLFSICRYYVGLFSEEKGERIHIDAENLLVDDLSLMPDIYYIIFDRYGSYDTLNAIYSHDNGIFLEELRKKGFYVIPEGLANYSQTGYSLASSLNMIYLDDMKATGLLNKGDIHHLIQNNRVLLSLKEIGYKIVHLGSWWYSTVGNSNADENINFTVLPDFSMWLYRNSILYPIGVFFGLDRSRENWQRELGKFDSLKEIHNRKDPTFTFAHFLVPHFPAVFKSDGTFLSRVERDNMSLEENYIGQLIYINKRIIEFVDVILSESEKPPVIIIQADEGPHPNYDFSLSNPESAFFLKAQQRILNMYYLPSKAEKALYDSITPVNTFRVLFNELFGTHYELLPDKSYRGFEDVTELVK